MSIEKRGDIPSPELQAQETEIRSVELELSRSSQQRIHNEQLKKLNEKYLLQADLALHEGKDFRAVTSTYNQRLAALEILQDYSSEST